MIGGADTIGRPDTIAGADVTRRRQAVLETLLYERAAEIGEDVELLENPVYVEAVSMELLNAYGGSMGEAFPSLVKEAVAAIVSRNRAQEKVEKVRRAVREQPTLMRVISPPFEFSRNGNGDLCQAVYVTPFGSRQLAQMQVLVLADDVATPELFSPILTDAESKVYFGAAPQTPLQLMAEQAVLDVEPQSDLPGMVQVVLKDEMNQTTLLFATQEIAEQIAALRKAGEEVVARHDHLKVYQVHGRKIPENEAFVEHLSADGPTLTNFIFSQTVAASFAGDIADLNAGRSIMVLLVGPTGVGKTSAVYATLRTAAAQAGKTAVAILIAPHTVGSMWHGETERRIAQAFEVAKKLAGEGRLVGILLDEIDALVGSTDARHESTVDHRVRLTIQQLLSQPLPPHVAVYATMNTHRGNLLHGPVAARFLLREYPRPTRRQMARLGAMFIEEDIAQSLQLTREEFGSRVSDFLFSAQFVLARLHLYSGASVPVRAGPPSGVPARAEDARGDVHATVRRGAAATLESFFSLLERDFHAVHFTEQSLLDNSYLRVPANDSARQVERLTAGAEGRAA